ncbi:MAG: type 2 lantipeptide synthetase LanM [Cyanobium usitatum Tobar12.5m-G36]|nr:type 2 lantipeptide synthetase LanM [Cyanobium usitatum Tobar12.5m-G36]
MPPATVYERTLREGWTLHQRLADSAGNAVEQTTAHASELLKAWLNIVAPDNPINFDKRLSWDGFTLQQAAWALDPPSGDTPQAPDWWPLLEGLRQAGRDAAVGGRSDLLAGRGANHPFVHVWRPVAAWALETLQQRCSALEPRLQLSEASWLDLGEALLERLCSTADQALWDLFNQRRTPGQMLLAHLGASGDGSAEPVHEAYDAFMAELLGSGYGLLFSDFPVLGRLLATITQLWLEGSEEMLQRMAASRAQLQQRFAIPPDAVLRKVQLGLSDPHRGGRAVAILSFAAVAPDDLSSNLRQVVYKPKDMQVDQAFQDFLQGLNSASTLPPLRCLAVLSCEGFGFMEWVEHRLCSSEEELASFYINAGRTMAVLHLLGCTDCHYENLIASGDQLVLIDTETLLEADLRDLISDDGDDPNHLSNLQTSMQGSVLRSGLLPQWLMVGAGKKRAFDISALGIQPPPAEREMPGWLGLNSDGMMAGRSTQLCELPTSLPVGLGKPQRLTDFVEQLCDGFALQLQEAMRLRAPLMEALSQFSGKPRRLVARATRLYFTMQRQMLEPASLRSAVAHGLKLEQLSRSFVLAGEKPHNWPMFRAELLQMERLDIPFYEHMIDGDELPLPEGLAPIPEFMKASGLAAARRRLEQLDEPEIAFQQQLIRGAIAARHLKTNASSPAAALGTETATAAAAADAFDRDVYFQEALRLGEELWDAAILDSRGRPEWLGMDLGADGESFHFGLIGQSLYSGGSGIALLFARLALAHAGEAAELWRHRAWSCLATLAELAERNSNEQLFRLVRDLPYGISGSGGILLALHLLDSAGLEAAAPLAEQLIHQLRPERLLADEGVDVIGGVTGLIGPLLLIGTSRAQELAAVCGERLVTLQLDSGGWGHSAASSQRKPPLTGFSHGAAGMAAALARLFRATGDARFAEAAAKALGYERSVFVSGRGNWPDFRSSNEADAFMLSWCHGAPGILLSRQAIKEAGLADAASASELGVARSSTLVAIGDLIGTSVDVAAHLCCGVLGLTSLLRLDAQASGLSLEPAVLNAERALISRARAGGGFTLFSVDNGTLSLPGLFTGKAGVALALLEASEEGLWLPAILSAGLAGWPLIKG